MCIVDKSIPDWLRPRLPTTASGVTQQGSCKNATASENKNRKRGGRRVRGRRKCGKKDAHP